MNPKLIAYAATAVTVAGILAIATWAGKIAGWVASKTVEKIYDRKTHSSGPKAKAGKIRRTRVSNPRKQPRTPVSN